MNNLTTDTITSISKALNAYFSSANISKKEIATRSNLSIGTVNNCFKADNFNIASFLSILDAMGINMYEFMEYMKTNNYPIPASANKAAVLNIDKINELIDKGAGEVQIAMRTGLSNEKISAALGATGDDEEEDEEDFDDDDDDFEDEEEYEEEVEVEEDEEELV